MGLRPISTNTSSAASSATSGLPVNNPISIDGGSVVTSIPTTSSTNQLPIETALQTLSQNNNTLTYSQTVNAVTTLTNQVSFNKNPLDRYANYTYHIKWSLTNDIIGSTLSSASEYQNLIKVVIAESGVTTGFNITEFEMDNICAPGAQVQMMLHTTFSMTVHEPYGMSLVDRLYSASTNVLLVKNHLTNPQFIEIWFTGYNEDGTVATRSMSKSLYKLFRVNLTEFIADASSSGTIYHIKGIIANSYANADHIATPPNGITIGNTVQLTTIGDFFLQLQSAMNTQQKSLEYDSIGRTQYQFNVPPWMKTWKFSKTQTTNQRSASISLKNNDSGSPIIQISRGMDISTILYFVIGMTDEGQQFVSGDDQINGGSSASATTANSGLVNIIAIHSQVKIIGFDQITNDYIRQIIYSFEKYTTNRSLIDQVNVTNQQLLTNQLNRAISQLSSGRYQRHYQYIFTGNNLDILKFDLNFNFTFQATIPNQLGDNTYNNFTVPPQVDPNSVSNTILNKIRAAQARKNTAVTTLFSFTANRATPEQIASANAELNNANTELDLLKSQNAPETFQTLFSNDSSGTQAVTNALANSRVSITTGGTVTQLTPAEISRQQYYLESLDVVPYTSIPIPISFRVDPSPINQITNLGGDSKAINSNTSQGPGNLPKSRSLIGTVLNDITSNVFLTKLELEIRGDPFWLGLGNIEEDKIINSTISSASTNTNGAWFYSGDVGFLLSFRTGTPPNEDTGYVDFSNSSVPFAGLYVITNVKSKFQNGVFTQTLTALRDNLLNNLSVLATEYNRNLANNRAATQNLNDRSQGSAL